MGAVVVIVLGVALIPLLLWLCNVPAGDPRYVRWPGRDGVRTLQGIAAAVFYVTLCVLIPFGVFLCSRVNKYGPDPKERRDNAAIAVGAAVVILVVGLPFLLWYLAEVGYLANPD